MKSTTDDGLAFRVVQHSLRRRETEGEAAFALEHHHPLVLVVSYRDEVADALGETLMGDGYRVLWERDADRAVERLRQRPPPDVVLLDCEGLPDCSLVHRMRSAHVLPMVVLCGSQDGVGPRALDLGADDYLVLSLEDGHASEPTRQELLARLRAALRHAVHLKAADVSAGELVIGELTVNLGRREVFVRGQRVPLVPMEYQVLVSLMNRAGRPVSKETLLDELGSERGGEDLLRGCIRRLRRRLQVDGHQAARIRYVPSEGYELVPHPWVAEPA